MNKLGILIGALVGTVIGGGIGWYLSQKKYTKIANEAIDEAKKEYDKLDNSIRKIFDAFLKKIAADPANYPHKYLGNHSGSGLANCCKIKLKSSGYRLVYEVIEDKVQIYVIAIGKREDSKVYREASKRRREG